MSDDAVKAFSPRVVVSMPAETRAVARTHPRSSSVPPRPMVDRDRRLRRLARHVRKLRGIERRLRMNAPHKPTLAEYASIPFLIAACAVTIPLAAVMMVVERAMKERR